MANQLSQNDFGNQGINNSNYHDYHITQPIFWTATNLSPPFSLLMLNLGQEGEALTFASRGVHSPTTIEAKRGADGQRPWIVNRESCTKSGRVVRARHRERRRHATSVSAFRIHYYYDAIDYLNSAHYAFRRPSTR